VGLVATLEIGVTAALTAAAATWLMFRRRTPRPRPAPEQGTGEGPAEIDEQPAEPLGFRVGVIDETDDAGGHRIYLNPWADVDQDPDQELPAVQYAELVAHRVGEL
jgi:hypothetical protein